VLSLQVAQHTAAEQVVVFGTPTAAARCTRADMTLDMSMGVKTRIHRREKKLHTSGTNLKKAAYID